MRVSRRTIMLLEGEGMVLTFDGGAAQVGADGKTYRLQPGELLRLDDAQGRMLAIQPVEPGTCLAHISIDPKSPAA